jgi:hypothetical protein
MIPFKSMKEARLWVAKYAQGPVSILYAPRMFYDEVYKIKVKIIKTNKIEEE